MSTYMSRYMRQRYHARRAAAIAELGGRCVRCGSTEKLELDHIDRATKSLDLGHSWSVSETRYRAELAKCQVLCRNCHKAKTSSEMGVEHGGGASGKRNCSCAPCRARKAEYQLRYRKASA